MHTGLIAAGIRQLGMIACALAFYGYPHQVIAQDAEPGHSFDAERALEWLPLEAAGGAVIAFPITLAGETVIADLDSGSNGGLTLTIARSVQDKHGFRKLGEQQVAAYGGTFARDVVLVPEITIGGMTLTNVPAGVNPDAGVARATVALQFLLSMTMQVEWDKQRIRFLVPGEFAEGHAAPVSYREDKRFLFVPVTLCGWEHDLIIDTGMESPVLIDERFAAQDCAPSVRSTLSAVGAGGDRTISEVIPVQSVQIGGQTFSNLLVQLQNNDDPLARKQIAGAIGFELLRQRNFVLDAEAEKIVFYGPQHQDGFKEPATIGIQFFEDGKALRVTNAMAGSPAALGGVFAGESICALGGVPISELGGDYRAINPPVGTILSVGLCSGTELRLEAVDFLGLAAPVAVPELRADANLQTGRLTALFAACDGWTEPDAALIASCTAAIEAPRLPSWYKLHALANRGQLYSASERHDDALRDYDRFLAENGPEAVVLTLRAEALIALGRLSEARVTLDEVRALAPDYMDLHLAGSNLALQQGDAPTALEAARLATTLAPEAAEPQAQLARVLTTMGLNEAACEAIITASALSPEDQGIGNVRSQIEANAGKQCDRKPDAAAPK